MPHYPSTLRFVETDEHYSIYLDRDDNEVYVGHGTGNILVDFDDLDLASLWRKLRVTTQYTLTSHRFVEEVRDLVTEPDRADDEIRFCNDCMEPHAEDEDVMHSVGDGVVCETCLEDYSFCEDCEEYVHSDYTRWTLHEETVCDRCVDRNYSYCDECDGYYHHDCYDDHQHGADCDCEEMRVDFAIPNGEGTLEHDTRATISLPAGEIDSVGVAKIAELLRDHSMAEYRTMMGYNEDGTLDHERYGALTPDDIQAARVAHNEWCRFTHRIEEIGTAWQSKQGNYTKRLSRFAYQEFGLKIPPAIISQVGNIGAEHSKGSDYAVEVTRHLNLPAYDFVHEGSCWWTEYNSSRCALKNSGGFGLRSFGAHGPEGRAWIMPLKADEHGDLKPTFETESPAAYVVFNGYGELGGYVGARILAQMTGMTYRKIEFGCDPMYVNSGAGYLVTSEEIASRYTDGSLHLYVDEHSDLEYVEASAKVSTEEVVNLLEPVGTFA